MGSRYLKRADNRDEFSLDFFQDCLRRRFQDPSLQVKHIQRVFAKGEQLTFDAKYQAESNIPIGVQKYHLHYLQGEKNIQADVMVKSRRDEVSHVKMVTQLYVQLGVDLPEKEIHQVISHSEFAWTNHREIDVYKMSESSTEFARYLPKFYGDYLAPEEGFAVLIMQALPDECLPKAVVDLADWNQQNIESCLKAIGHLHAVWYGKTEALIPRPWFAQALTAKKMEKCSGFLLALAKAAKEAAGELGDFISPENYQRQLELIRQIPTWWAELDAMPKTLIQNDFVPKNVALKDHAAFVFDWELASIHVPQRDVGEFLAYVLPENVTRETLLHYIHFHRQVLEKVASVAIDVAQWEKGCKLALYDYWLQRLSACVLLEKFEPRNVAKLYRTVIQMIELL